MAPSAALPSAAGSLGTFFIMSTTSFDSASSGPKATGILPPSAAAPSASVAAEIAVCTITLRNFSPASLCRIHPPPCSAERKVACTLSDWFGCSKMPIHSVHSGSTWRGHACGYRAVARTMCGPATGVAESRAHLLTHAHERRVELLLDAELLLRAETGGGRRGRPRTAAEVTQVVEQTEQPVRRRGLLRELRQRGEELGAVGGGDAWLVDEAVAHEPHAEGHALTVATAVHVLRQVRRELGERDDLRAGESRSVSGARHDPTTTTAGHGGSSRSPPPDEQRVAIVGG